MKSVKIDLDVDNLTLDSSRNIAMVGKKLLELKISSSRYTSVSSAGGTFRRAAGKVSRVLLKIISVSTTQMVCINPQQLQLYVDTVVAD